MKVLRRLDRKETSMVTLATRWDAVKDLQVSRPGSMEERGAGRYIRDFEG